MKFKSKEFEKEILGDTVDINRELLKVKSENIESLDLEYFKKNIKVDFINQKIFVDGNEVNLDLKEKLTDVRWINFKRNIVSYRMRGLKSREFIYGVGFQGKINNENIQRFILIDEKGYTLEKKK